MGKKKNSGGKKEGTAPVTTTTTTTTTTASNSSSSFSPSKLLEQTQIRPPASQSASTAPSPLHHNNNNSSPNKDEELNNNDNPMKTTTTNDTLPPSLSAYFPRRDDYVVQSFASCSTLTRSYSNDNYQHQQQSGENTNINSTSSNCESPKNDDEDRIQSQQQQQQKMIPSPQNPPRNDSSVVPTPYCSPDPPPSRTNLTNSSIKLQQQLEENSSLVETVKMSSSPTPTANANDDNNSDENACYNDDNNINNNITPKPLKLEPRRPEGLANLRLLAEESDGENCEEAGEEEESYGEEEEEQEHDDDFEEEQIPEKEGYFYEDSDDQDDEYGDAAARNNNSVANFFFASLASPIRRRPRSKAEGNFSNDFSSSVSLLSTSGTVANSSSTTNNIPTVMRRNVFFENGVETEVDNPFLHYMHVGLWHTLSCDYYQHRRPAEGEIRSQVVVWLHNARPRNAFVFLVYTVENGIPEGTLFDKLKEFLYGYAPRFGIKGRYESNDAKNKKKKISGRPVGVEIIEVPHSAITAVDYSPGLVSTRFALEASHVTCRWFESEEAARAEYCCSLTSHSTMVAAAAAAAAQQQQQLMMMNASSSNSFGLNSDAASSSTNNNSNSNNNAFNNNFSTFEQQQDAAAKMGTVLGNLPPLSERAEKVMAATTGEKIQTNTSHHNSVTPTNNNTNNNDNSVWRASSFALQPNMYFTPQLSSTSFTSSQQQHDQQGGAATQHRRKRKGNSSSYRHTNDRIIVHNHNDHHNYDYDVDDGTQTEDTVSVGETRSTASTNQTDLSSALVTKKSFKAEDDDDDEGGKRGTGTKRRRRLAKKESNNNLANSMTPLAMPNALLFSPDKSTPQQQQVKQESSAWDTKMPSSTIFAVNESTSNKATKASATNGGLIEFDETPNSVASTMKFPDQANSSSASKQQENKINLEEEEKKKKQQEQDENAPRTITNTMIVCFTQDPNFNAVLREIVLPGGSPTNEGLGSHVFTDSVVERQRLLRLVEAGIPSWAIFSTRYGIFYHRYLRVVVGWAVNLWPLIALALGLYDLYSHMPYVHQYLVPLFSLFEDSWVFRLSLGIAYIFSYCFYFFSSLFSYLTTTLSFLSVVFSPLSPLMELIYPIFSLLYTVVTAGATFGRNLFQLVFGSVGTILVGTVRALFYPFISILSLAPTTASTGTAAASSMPAFISAMVVFWSTVLRPLKNLGLAIYNNIIHAGSLIARHEASLRMWIVRKFRNARIIVVYHLRRYWRVYLTLIVLFVVLYFGPILIGYIFGVSSE